MTALLGKSMTETRKHIEMPRYRGPREQSFEYREQALGVLVAWQPHFKCSSQPRLSPPEHHRRSVLPEVVVVRVAPSTASVPALPERTKPFRRSIEGASVLGSASSSPRASVA